MNGAQTPSAARRPIDGLREWATSTPERTALTDGASSLSFRDLLTQVETTSAAAAHAASALAPDAFLPVLVDRSVGSAVAVLSCLLGRVRFFPIDAAAAPDLKERLRQRAGSPDRFLAGCADGTGLPGAWPVSVDAGAAFVDDPQAADDDAALVLFSSGSTGEPKGIVLDWRALEQRWRSREASYEPFAFGHERRQPLVLPMDSSWGVAKLSDVACGFGGHLVDLGRIGPAEFLRRMAPYEPTAMAIPSQAGRLLARLPDRLITPLPSVRRLHVTAEGFRYEHARALQRVFGPQTLLVHSLASSEGGREIGGQIPLTQVPESGRVPIGRPLFPADLRLVPIDGLAPGTCEVHVGGAIAREYLDDPGRTAERFYRADDGRQLWRSGDLVRVSEDGTCWHEGRMDDLVKVGGKLASPGDVTAVLATLPGITNAITIPVVTNGITRLVAHVEVDEQAPLTLADTRAALVAALPAHAVPAAVLRHARLPLTERGKVDRGALMAGPFESW